VGGFQYHVEHRKSRWPPLRPIYGTGHFGGLTGAFERLVKRANLEGVTPHTLRHSFASVAGDLGYAEATIAAMLGHAAGSVTARYVHHLDAVLITAVNRVADRIMMMMDGKASADVVPLRGHL
jgi:integrase